MRLKCACDLRINHRRINYSSRLRKMKTLFSSARRRPIHRRWSGFERRPFTVIARRPLAAAATRQAKGEGEGHGVHAALPAKQRVKKSKPQAWGWLRSVIPAKAGIHFRRQNKLSAWVPASAGTTLRSVSRGISTCKSASTAVFRVKLEQALIQVTAFAGPAARPASRRISICKSASTAVFRLFA